VRGYSAIFDILISDGPGRDRGRVESMAEPTGAEHPRGVQAPPSPSRPAALDAESAVGRALIRRLTNPFLLRLFFLKTLPLALAAGVKLRALDARTCTTSVPYGWRSTNPFRSTYFAALSMAAELSTGALGMLAVRLAPEPVAMLIVGMTASFEKKATALATFTCDDGDRVFAAVASTLATGEPATADMTAVGRLPDGAVVARFTVRWSFKRRRKAA
jgi:hypothetical protein